jgi:hypothetical protein
VVSSVSVYDEALRSGDDWAGSFRTRQSEKIGEDGVLTVECSGPLTGSGHDPAKVIGHAFHKQLGFSAGHFGEDFLHDLFVGDNSIRLSVGGQKLKGLSVGAAYRSKIAFIYSQNSVHAQPFRRCDHGGIGKS